MKSTKYVGESMKASSVARGESGKPVTSQAPKMKAGAASGPGRLQKAKAYGAKQK